MAFFRGNSQSVCVVQPDSAGRARICQLLRSTPQLELAGVASDSASARRVLAQCTPDVLLVDLSASDGEALELLGGSGVPELTRVLGMIPAAASSLFFRGLELGVAGWVHCDDPPERVVQSIEQLAEGGMPISPRIGPFVLRHVRPSEPPPRPGSETQPKLTPRERETLRFVAKGFSVAEVASLLQISRHTVTTHVRSIYRKLEVHSRSAAIYEAMSLGLLQHL